MSGRRGSNPLPTAWKAVALPDELLPQFASNTKKGFQTFEILSVQDLQQKMNATYLRGERRIRTSEGFANRFTVCPI
jgi:hypothetical protein